MGLQCPPWEGEINFSTGMEAGGGWLGTGWTNWRKEQILAERLQVAFRGKVEMVHGIYGSNPSKDSKEWGERSLKVTSYIQESP